MSDEVEQNLEIVVTPDTLLGIVNEVEQLVLSS
jgi:hypothetical protein